MNQQINLFQPIFRKQRKLLSFAALLQTCAIMIVALAALYGFGWWQTGSLSNDLTALKQQHTQRLALLEKVSRESSKHNNTDETAKEIARLEAELAAERYLVSVLGDSEFGKRGGFSIYLESFSRRVVPGMWLKRFTVFENGKHLLIEGGALSAELLPTFIQGLSEESHLSGIEFSVLQMARQEPTRSWIEFILSSKEIESAELLSP